MCSGTVVCFRFAAAAEMDGDAFAFVEDLDAAGGQPRFDLGAGEAVGTE
jgi:hypothetical protein